MRQGVLDIWTDFNKPIESRLHFMYLDIRGLVTTGLGNLIDATGDPVPPPLRPPTDAERSASHVQARRLQWLTSDGSVASPNQIDAEWDQIKARLDQAQFGGGTFEQFSHLVISDDEVDRIVGVRLSEMETSLKTRPAYADFDNFPADAQLAVMSMSWGMGPAFGRLFPKFEKAVTAGDWTTAAAECRFKPDVGTITTRNDNDQLLFRNAAAVIADGLDPDALVWPSSA